MKQTQQAKNHLDEMQDIRLLRMEEAGFWLTFWGLMAVILVQFARGTTLGAIAGEAAVLVLQSVYLAFSTVRNGLWTRRYPPTTKTNLVFSLIPAAVIGSIHAVRQFLVLREQIRFPSVLAILFVMGVVYGLCFVLLEILRVLYQRRRDALDDVEEKET